MDPVEEILNIPFKPWQYMTYTIERTVVRRRYGSTQIHTYPAQFETLRSYDRAYWKPGDVVKFGHGITGYRKSDTWRNWFMTSDAFDAYLKMVL